MRVSDLGRKQVRPLHFLVALTFALVLLTGIIGVPLMQIGHVLAIPRWMTAAVLAFAWGASVLAVMRQGRAALRLQWAALLVGMALFFGIDLVPSLGWTSASVVPHHPTIHQVN